MSDVIRIQLSAGLSHLNISSPTQHQKIIEQCTSFEWDDDVKQCCNSYYDWIDSNKKLDKHKKKDLKNIFFYYDQNVLFYTPRNYVTDKLKKFMNNYPELNHAQVRKTFYLVSLHIYVYI